LALVGFVVRCVVCKFSKYSMHPSRRGRPRRLHGNHQRPQVPVLSSFSIPVILPNKNSHLHPIVWTSVPTLPPILSNRDTNQRRTNRPKSKSAREFQAPYPRRTTRSNMRNAGTRQRSSKSRTERKFGEFLEPQMLLRPRAPRRSERDAPPKGSTPSQLPSINPFESPVVNSDNQPSFNQYGSIRDIIEQLEGSDSLCSSQAIPSPAYAEDSDEDQAHKDIKRGC